MSSDWQRQLDEEFARAEAAAAGGNPGQARVSARRAAGLALRLRLEMDGQPVTTTSAYDLLQQLADRAGLPDEIRRAARLLTMRLTPEFRLPVEADLVQEARRVCTWLLPDWTDHK